VTQIVEPEVLDLCSFEQIILDFIRPGKPVENGYIESFNGKLRDECLNWRCSSPSPMPDESCICGDGTTTSTGRSYSGGVRSHMQRRKRRR
jgi:transposase InsO family protein